MFKPKWAMSSPDHDNQSFFISYLVPHFSEVWKYGKVWQGQVKVALFPLVILYLHVLVVPHFSEVWTYGIVWQSRYCHTLSLGNEPVIIPALLSSTLLRCVELWMNRLKNTGYSHTFPPVINPLSFFTHLVPHFLEVWKCGIVWQIQDIHVVVLFSSHELIIILYNVLSSTVLWGVEVWNNLRKEELSKEWQGVHDWGRHETISWLIFLIWDVYTCNSVFESEMQVQMKIWHI